MAAAPAALLLDELVEEVLLRIPPGDPARLLAAALVCKSWCRVLAAAGFRRRFFERHRRPPLLGFLGSIPIADYSCSSRFVPTSSFRPPRGDHSGWYALHSGHGRVLFFKVPWGYDPRKNRLLVWDPITDERRELPPLSWSPYPFSASWNAVVLCAATAGGCNHLGCHRGPFLVVFVGTVRNQILACVYSSEAAAWSEPTFMMEPDRIHTYKTQALVGNALYLQYYVANKILKFDLMTREISPIRLPPEGSDRHIMLMAMEDGRLGFATVHESRLHLWSREVGPNGDARWAQSRVIELAALLPDCVSSRSPLTSPHLTGGVGLIFMRTIAGNFTIDLTSGQIKKDGDHGFGKDFVPFMSFCTPELSAAHTGGYGADDSSA
ncbi:unnamed protein product [Urochloa decumbens]|uniref:F-box protein AT5G49610-like beta-propeller domain-containing protein n=1 Tax=Urochloa decumbens TaxID=240449 RepID=A0ABC9GE74_9POAL